MTSADVRARLANALRLDLIGPEPGEPQAGEVLGIPPSRFYLTGFLAPLNAPVSQKADDDEQRVQILRAEATNFPVSAVFEKLDEVVAERFGPPRLIRPRLGQGTYRTERPVTLQHSPRCLRSEHRSD